MKNLKEAEPQVHLKEPIYPNQIIPIVLTAVICFIGIALLWGHVHLLNLFVGANDPIVPVLHWHDIAVGTIIYLKTAIDFALFIGGLMADYPGWKNRIIIEAGTALGNIVGTLCILTIWTLFKEIKILLAIMIILAGLVLFKLAESGFEHIQIEKITQPFLRNSIQWVETILQKINAVFAPVLNKIVPHANLKDGKKKGFWSLFLLSFSIPFILGSDDFAGYISLFNVVNVTGFAMGVFIGHMILNNALFLSPHTTTKIVKNPIIACLGSIAFIAIAVWGFIEAGHLIETIFAAT